MLSTGLELSVGLELGTELMMSIGLALRIALMPTTDRAGAGIQHRAGAGHWADVWL